jgi:hypothetical protein
VEFCVLFFCNPKKNERKKYRKKKEFKLGFEERYKSGGFF